MAKELQVQKGHEVGSSAVTPRIEPANAQSCGFDQSLKSPVRVVRADSVEALNGLRHEWERVRRSAGFETSNADPDRFLATTLAIPGANPYLALIYEADRPAGLVLGRTMSRRLVGRVGYLRVPTPKVRCLDVVYGGLLSTGSRAVEERAVGLIAQELEERRFDHILINHLPGEARAHPLCQSLAQHLRCGRLTTIEPHWLFRFVPGDFEATMRRFSSKHSRNLRREDRVLTKHFGGDVRMRVFTSSDDLDELIKQTARLAKTTYQAAIGVSFEDIPVWRARLKREANAGLLRAYWLVCRGEPIAFWLGKMCGSVYVPDATGYIASYRDLSPGTVLLIRVFEDLCSIGATALDYGFGDAHYKRMYGTDCTDETTFLLFGRTIRGRCARHIQVTTHSIDRAAKRLTEASNLSLRIKSLWRRSLGSAQAKKVQGSDSHVDKSGDS